MISCRVQDNFIGPVDDECFFHCPPPKVCYGLKHCAALMAYIDNEPLCRTYLTEPEYSTERWHEMYEKYCTERAELFSLRWNMEQHENGVPLDRLPAFSVIYGQNGGFHRYFILDNGDIYFSAGHGPFSAGRAAEVGFVVRVTSRMCCAN